MGQTRVDLLHLLEDLRDAYPGSLEETVLTETVANSLDSGATRIVLTADPAQAALLVLDDGAGMKRAELARYHDVAASRKTRGEGIGFAGVGIKLGLLASSEVVTETRHGKTHVATRWRLASRHRAPWKWEPPAGALGRDGTAVTLRLRNALSPLLDASFIEETLRRHFQPLFEPEFAGILGAHYPRGITFVVNGRGVRPEAPALPTTDRRPVALRLPRRRLPSAFGHVWRSQEDPLPEGQRGLAVSTFGKIIKRGWDWLGIFPSDPDRVGGLVEAPLLSACLTLAKNDFIRTGPKGALYLAFRKSLQEAVSGQLAAWGETPGHGEPRSRRARPHERDLAVVLEELAGDFPLLQSLIEKRSGGQKKLPVGGSFTEKGIGGESAAPAEETVVGGPQEPGIQRVREEPGEETAAPQGPQVPPLELPAAPRGRSRPAHFVLKLQFEGRPESDEPGRLAEDTVWVNEAHPAYRRAAACRSEGYHIAFAAAMALSRVAVLPEQQRAFVNAFLARWGEAIERPVAAGRKRRRRKKNP